METKSVDCKPMADISQPSSCLWSPVQMLSGALYRSASPHGGALIQHGRMLELEVGAPRSKRSICGAQKLSILTPAVLQTGQSNVRLHDDALASVALPRSPSLVQLAAIPVPRAIRPPPIYAVISYSSALGVLQLCRETQEWPLKQLRHIQKQLALYTRQVQPTPSHPFSTPCCGPTCSESGEESGGP